MSRYFKSRYIHSNGHALPGTKVRVWVGTSYTTQATVWDAQSGGNSGTSVVADAYGIAKFWIDDDQYTSATQFAVSIIGSGTSQHYPLDIALPFNPSAAWTDLIPQTSAYSLGSQVIPWNGVYGRRLVMRRGTAALPSITFTSNADTGLYSDVDGFGNNSLVGISVQGQARVLVRDYALVSQSSAYFLGDLLEPWALVCAKTHYASSGTTGSPAYAFRGDTNTGLYNPSDGILGLVTNSAARVLVSDTEMGPQTSSYPLGKSTLPWHAVYAKRHFAGMGTAALPSITFTSNPTDGLHSGGAGRVDITASGVSRIRVDTNGLTPRTAGYTLGNATLPWGGVYSGKTFNQFGTVGAPAITFTSHITTGIYSPGVGVWAVAASGVEAFRSTYTTVMGRSVTSHTGPLVHRKVAALSMAPDTVAGMAGEIVFETIGSTFYGCYAGTGTTIGSQWFLIGPPS